VESQPVITSHVGGIERGLDHKRDRATAVRVSDEKPTIARLGAITMTAAVANEDVAVPERLVGLSE
jgi:hypothetical protein